MSSGSSPSSGDASGEASGSRIALTSLAGIRLIERLGEGGRSTVFAGEWNGRSVAVKLYKSVAVVRHARKHPLALPRYEYERNLSFFRAPGLREHVAEPLGFIDEAGVSALVQERLHGRLYYFHYVESGRVVDPELFDQVARIVRLSHEAGLFDVDLHSMNVMVEPGPGGRPVARIFDFNLISYVVRPPNPWTKALLRSGLMDPRSRDLRKLRNFHDLRRVERKLLGFYR